MSTRLGPPSRRNPPQPESPMRGRSTRRPRRLDRLRLRPASGRGTGTNRARARRASGRVRRCPRFVPTPRPSGSAQTCGHLHGSVSIYSEPQRRILAGCLSDGTPRFWARSANLPDDRTEDAELLLSQLESPSPTAALLPDLQPNDVLDERFVVRAHPVGEGGISRGHLVRSTP